MRLAEYVASQNKHGLIARLARDSGLAYGTVYNLAKKGELLKRYDLAQRLSDATGGAVSVAELCSPPSEPEQKSSSESGEHDAVDPARSEPAA